MSPPTHKSMGYWSVVSIGVGGMVGGGIFAVLGLAVQLAHGGTPVAFFLAGLVAMVTSYSYAKLSIAYPSQGGTVEFLNQAYGTGVITGGMNILLWLSYVVMLSLYAYAFGSYGATFFPAASHLLWKHLLISGVIVLMTAVNVFGAKVVGESEEWIVGFKITILLLFVGVGLWSVSSKQLQFSTWTPPLQLVAGGMIIFLAYEGFELIANTAGEVKDPQKTLHRAYYSAVGFVILLYILVSTVTVGNLPIAKIIGAKDYALAMAAKPFLGNAGFVLIAIAALLSTASAINATLYGASRVSYVIAKEGELPKRLDRNIWNRPIEGLFITSALTLLVANLFDLSSISMMGSAGFLLIFASVNGSNFRLHQQTGGKRWISALGVVVCLLALVALFWQTMRQSPANLIVLVVMVVFAVAVELIYRAISGRSIHPTIRDVR
jgi:amino acid transporter